MKRHYYVINRGMSREVLVFNSRDDINKWLNVEPVDGFVPDCNHMDVDDERAFRDRQWIPCACEEARFWWIRKTLRELNEHTLCQCQYTGIEYYCPCY